MSGFTTSWSTRPGQQRGIGVPSWNANFARRSGAVYHAVKDRSGLIHKAWKAAGSPRQVFRGRGPFPYWVKRQQGGHVVPEEATEAEWETWKAWEREKHRIRRELDFKRLPDSAYQTGET